MRPPVTDLERLWCVYELASFTAHNLKAGASATSDLVFLPLRKVPTLLLMQATAPRVYTGHHLSC